MVMVARIHMVMVARIHMVMVARVHMVMVARIHMVMVARVQMVMVARICMVLVARVHIMVARIHMVMVLGCMSWLLGYTLLCSLVGVQEALPETRQEQSNDCEETREGNVELLLFWFPLSPPSPFSFPPCLPAFLSLPLCFFLFSLFLILFSPFPRYLLLTTFSTPLPLSSSLLPHYLCNLSQLLKSTQDKQAKSKNPDKTAVKDLQEQQRAELLAFERKAITEVWVPSVEHTYLLAKEHPPVQYSIIQ